MPGPQSYFLDDRCDYDPRPRGSARLVADVAGLPGIRARAEARTAPGPHLTPRQRKIRRKHLIILVARLSGLPLSVIADAFDLTPPEISRVCSRMGYDEVAG